MSTDTTPSPPDTRPDTPEPRRGGGVGRALLIIVLLFVALGLLAVLLVGRFVAGFNPFDREAVDRTQPAVLIALRDISEYRAASGEFQVIVDSAEEVDDLPLAIAGERTLFVASGSVDAAVDFSAIGDGAVTVDDARERVRITLPSPALTDARIDPDRSYVFSRERGILDRLAGVFQDSPVDEQALYQLAEAQLEESAQSSELVGLARRNTETMLRSLLLSLGFTDITITFE